MAKVYGIDLGTTYSVISTLDDNGNAGGYRQPG